MAEFVVAGFDELEDMLLQRSEDVQRIAPDMLRAGANILIAAQRAELQRIARGDQSIGTLAKSLTIGNVKTSSDKLKMYIAVYPQGNQPHGNPLKKRRGFVTNAQVGFALEFGSSEMSPRPWACVATQKSASAIHDAMQRVWEEKQNG